VNLVLICGDISYPTKPPYNSPTLLYGGRVKRSANLVRRHEELGDAGTYKPLSHLTAGKLDKAKYATFYGTSKSRIRELAMRQKTLRGGIVETAYTYLESQIHIVLLRAQLIKPTQIKHYLKMNKVCVNHAVITTPGRCIHPGDLININFFPELLNKRLRADTLRPYEENFLFDVTNGSLVLLPLTVTPWFHFDADVSNIFFTKYNP
jgi:hypothetical protein